MFRIGALDILRAAVSGRPGVAERELHRIDPPARGLTSSVRSTSGNWREKAPPKRGQGVWLYRLARLAYPAAAPVSKDRSYGLGELLRKFLRGLFEHVASDPVQGRHGDFPGRFEQRRAHATHSTG